MTPQATFMVMAPIEPRREAELRELLASMNNAPGCVNARNTLMPFAEFDTLHFARFLIVDDKTLDDIRLHDFPTRTYPLYLAFLGDLDGDRNVFLEELARRASTGLRAIFSCCDGFAADSDLLGWMKEHSVRSAANYVNWPGRTVRHVREDAALRAALDLYMQSNVSALAGLAPRQIHARLREHVDAETAAGRLTLSAASPTPPGWQIANLLHMIGIPVLLIFSSPLLIVVGAIVLIRLRGLEKKDPEICPRVDQAHSDHLALLEDHDVANQFSALGSVKPGMVRRWTVRFALWIVNYGARHIYTRGRLARVRTIHFARWVSIDRKQRVLFLSNYDGSLESYMDDFINKAGFGLNFAFSSGIGYPRTNWLVLDGCTDEQKFKEYLRRHQLPTQVWYIANPGLTAVDLERNARVRRGLESASMSEAEACAWVALL